MSNEQLSLLQTYILVPLIVLGAFVVLHLILRRVIRRFPTLSRLGWWIPVYAFLIFFLIYFQGQPWLTHSLITFGTFNISLRLLINAFLILTMASQLSGLITQRFLPRVYSRYQLDRGVQFTFNRLLHYVIMILAFFFTASIVGINLNSFAVFAGVLGVGIGFGLQNITSNFISGLILLFERPIKIGDRVIVEEIIGDVERINMRATVIRSLTNEHIIVPNSYFLEEHVINRSYESPNMKLVAPVGVSYDSDIEQVRRVLLEVARSEAAENPFVLMDPPPYVYFDGFGDSALNFELFVWVSDPRELIHVKTNINFRIFNRFQAEGIEIPFPQRDLHLRSVDAALIDPLRANRRSPGDADPASVPTEH